jgi:hypothetical protein
MKYEIDEMALTDKDWGDVVRWVLPEAKVPFFLKDLKERSNCRKACHFAS